MAITQTFMNAVSSGDIRSLRIMMKDSLLVDLTFQDFDEMSRLAQEVPGLYDAHDGRAFEDSSGWDDAYLNRLMVQVIGNFSHERLEHLKKVVRFLYPMPKQTQASRQASQDEAGEYSSMSGQHHTSYQEQKREDAQNGRISEIVKVGCPVVGAAVGGGLAVAAGASCAVIALGVAAGAVTGVVIGAELASHLK